jgi:MgtC family
VFAALVPEEASPTRVAAQVVSGIGFLGAGLIFREGMSVRGLNTAARNLDYKLTSTQTSSSASRSTQASIVRAFFMATSNTCVRLSIMASPRSFRRWRQRANHGDRSAEILLICMAIMAVAWTPKTATLTAAFSL